MDSPYSERLKLGRAKEHYEALNKELRRFLESEPYSLTLPQRETDAQGTKMVFYIADTQDIPTIVPILIGDTCFALRSALDHLFWRLLLSPTNRLVYFPLFDDPDKFRASTKGYDKLVTPQVWAEAQGLQPYQTGDDTLFVIHKLKRIDKHRFIPVSIFAAQPSTIDLQNPPPGKSEFHGVNFMRVPIEKGAEIASFRNYGFSPFQPQPDVQMEAHITFKLRFRGDPAAAQDKEVLETLRHGIDLVESTLNLFP